MFQRIISFFIMIFSGLLMALGVLFAPFESHDVSVTKTFDDGSKMIREANYPALFHQLYDGVGIYKIESDYMIKALPQDMDLDDEVNYPANLMRQIQNTQTKAVGIFPKYAFDDSGYVAVYDYDRDTDTGAYALCDIAAGSIQTFDSLTKLNRYAAAHDIVLGEWYYAAASDTAAEVLRQNDWTLYTVDCGVSVVRCGCEDMFAGKISQYASADNLLAFRIEISYDLLASLRGFGNPVLPHSAEDEPIRYSFFLNTPIYCDCYVVVNTADGSYALFDEKKDVKQIFEQQSADLKWNKL